MKQKYVFYASQCCPNKYYIQSPLFKPPMRWFFNKLYPWWLYAPSWNSFLSLPNVVFSFSVITAMFLPLSMSSLFPIHKCSQSPELTHFNSVSLIYSLWRTFYIYGVSTISFCNFLIFVSSMTSSLNIRTIFQIAYRIFSQRCLLS